jgi:magnesium transporter
MIHTMLCAEAHQLKPDLDRADIGRLLADEQSLLWLDFERATADELRFLASEFGFHPLALEDATKPHQRPKIDRYDDFYFIVCYDIDYDEEDDRIAEHELDIFVGKNFLITVHQEPIEEIAEVAGRFHHNLAQFERGIGALLYSLLDTVVDHYFPVVDRIGERIEELELRVLGGTEREGLQDIFVLKREMVDLRRVIAPERDVMAVLARRELPLISEASAVYFQDIYDHVLRVTDTIDSYRDLLGSALDSYLTMNANNMNQVMKTLTSVSIILMSVTLIAGIYGMNFENMPELGTRYGYFVSLLAMALLGLALYRYFKRKDWL